MQIEQIVIRKIQLPLKQTFKNSQTSIQTKTFHIIEVVDSSGQIGYGETVAFDTPWYTEETIDTVFTMLDKHIVPLLQKHPITHPNEMKALFATIKRNHMAKAGIEEAIWDLYAIQEHISLKALFGGKQTKILAGASLGIEDSEQALLEKINQAVKNGYKRIKVKIKPDWDLEILKTIRTHNPHLPLMVDANGAYSLKDMHLFKQMDALNLLMIEQPFKETDFLNHALLQKEINTPICLDESIQSVHDAQLAIALNSCQIMNIKIGRVGGWQPAKEIHDLCEKADIPVWCGGMFESGIGRAHSIALASLANFSLPCDMQSSEHYWEQDLISPQIIVDNGEITVPDQPGIGFTVNRTLLKQHTIEKSVYHI